MIKEIIKQIVPPVLINLYRAYRKRNISNVSDELSIHWEGDYQNWQQAMQYCTGYDAENILEKVKASVIKVKNGEAVYERDSVLFDKIQYSWPLLSCLMKIALENNSTLHIVDFGGSLGSTYFQNRNFLKNINSLKWHVVEQENFVETGKAFIADDTIRFYKTIEEALEDMYNSVLLVSGVLQCLDNPYEWIRKMIEYKFQYILIDRTAFIENETDVLTVQHVPEEIYKASYPAWFFNEKKLIAPFEQQYEVLVDFESFADLTEINQKNQKMYRKGFFLKKK
jgi:putative methyltransferase (TIGR04325 family)